jgi:NAD(P)-dependent dehydrogenase (short-subunit alcohol dehydrogenase family)
VKAVLLGATSGMGRALSRLLAERGESLFLLGIPAEDLQRSAKDLEARGAAQVGWLECDLLQPRGFAAALERADQALGGFDTVVVSAGLFGSQERLEADPEFCQKLLAANFANTVAFCEEARKRMLPRGGGRLCVFSSVAGERGRKPVILYGAAKAGLTRYLEGLDHKFRSEGLVTITVKPGFVRTSMTEGLKAPPFAGEPEGVARQVLRALDRGTPVVYAPPMWALVMLVIRNLPRFVMRRIGF